MTYGYDNANRLTSVTDWNSNSTTYSYDDAGRMTSTTLPSGTGIVSTNTYDNANRLTGITHVKNGSTTVASVAYTLDDVGNRTQRVDQRDAPTPTPPPPPPPRLDALATRRWSSAGTPDYDDADRLTEVTPPSPASPISYTWDDNGDLTARGSDSFSWDYEDRMVSATVNSVTTTFAYRGDGLATPLPPGSKLAG
ncbi:MAG: RHS repeat protein [Dehalococcoidia bacterium]|nr:RHS repeat protein [Dehalococcoidia bacterium]